MTSNTLSHTNTNMAINLYTKKWQVKPYPTQTQMTHWLNDSNSTPCGTAANSLLPNSTPCGTTTGRSNYSLWLSPWIGKMVFVSCQSFAHYCTHFNLLLHMPACAACTNICRKITKLWKFLRASVLWFFLFQYQLLTPYLRPSVATILKISEQL